MSSLSDGVKNKYHVSLDTRYSRYVNNVWDTACVHVFVNRTEAKNWRKDFFCTLPMLVFYKYLGVKRPSGASATLNHRAVTRNPWSLPSMVRLFVFKELSDVLVEGSVRFTTRFLKSTL